MDTERRLQQLEDQVAYLGAIVDGGQEQSREATAYVVGIVTRYLHEKGLIDGAALRRYVSTFGGEESDTDDYMGDLVRRFGAMLDFQEHYPSEFQVPPADVT